MVVSFSIVVNFLGVNVVNVVATTGVCRGGDVADVGDEVVVRRSVVVIGRVEGFWVVVVLLGISVLMVAGYVDGLVVVTVPVVEEIFVVVG